MLFFGDVSRGASPIHTCLVMGEAFLETSPKNNMTQDMINSDNMNSTESTIPNIFKSLFSTYFRSAFHASLCSLHIPIISFTFWPNTNGTRDLLILRIYVLLEIALVI